MLCRHPHSNDASVDVGGGDDEGVGLRGPLYIHAACPVRDDQLAYSFGGDIRSAGLCDDVDPLQAINSGLD